MASFYKVASTGKWRARVRRPGAPTQSRNFLTKGDAVAWARGVEHEIERGLWHPSDEANATTLAAAIDRYARGLHPRYLKKLDKTFVLRVPQSASTPPPGVSKLDGKTVGSIDRPELMKVLSSAPILGVQMLDKPKEASILRRLKADPLARKVLSMIHTADIAVTRDRWLTAGLKPGSVHRRFNTLGHLFTVARMEWRMPTLVNPVHGVVLSPDDDARDRRVSDKERTAIGDAGADTRHLADLMFLAVETACRREELVRLRWDEVNLKARTAFIRKTKNGVQRTVPLTRAAASLLETMPRVGARVFHGWSTPDSASQAFKRAVKRARGKYVADCKKRHAKPDGKFLVDVRLHDLRHEACSRLAARGIEVHQLAKITGHKTLRMLMRYYNPTDEELVALLD